MVRKLVLERAPDGRLILPPLDDDDAGWIRLVPLRDALLEAGNELATDEAPEQDHFLPSPSAATCYLRKPITRADWEMLNAKFVIPDDICLVRDNFVRDGPGWSDLIGNVTPKPYVKEAAILGCYWGVRHEPAAQVASRILAMLAGLAEVAKTMPVDGLAGPWVIRNVEPNWLDKRKRRRPSTEGLPTRVDKLARLIDAGRPNLDGGPLLRIPKMYAQAHDDGGLWKIDTSADTTSPQSPNYVLMEAADDQDLPLHQLLLDHAPALLSAVVAAWEPDDEAHVTTSAVLDALDDKFPWIDNARPVSPPGVVTWLPAENTASVPPELPGAVITNVAGGVMIDARHDDGTVPSPQEMVDLVNAWRDLGAFRYP